MKKSVLGIVLALFLLGGALEGLRMLWKVGEPVELDLGEGTVLRQAALLADLKDAYHPLEQYPYFAFNYPPLYHLALRMVSAVLHDPLLSGRLVSVTAGLWLVLLSAWTVLRATRGYAPPGIRWYGAAFSAACVLVLPSMQWVPLVRVDTLGVALQFTGLSLLCGGRFRLRNQVVAFCFLLLGLYTKQNLLAIPAASVLLVGLVRPARALQLAGGLAAAGLAILAMLARASDGGVLRHLIAYNMHHAFSLNRALYFEDLASKNTGSLIAMGLATFWLTIPRANRGRWREVVAARLANLPLRRVGVGFGLAAALGFVASLQAGKEGATPNYCLEWQLALCPLTGVFMVLVLRNWTGLERRRTLYRPMLLLLLGATGIQFAVQAGLDCNNAVGLTGAAREARFATRRNQAELVKLISTFPGPVVCENMVALLQAGKPIVVDPPIIKMITEAGAFDESPLLKKTSDGFFDAFILDAGESFRHYTPRMLDAIHRNYRRAPFPNPNYLVYIRPQP